MLFRRYFELTSPDQLSRPIGVKAMGHVNGMDQSLGTVTMAQKYCIQNHAADMEEVVIIRAFSNGLGGEVHVVPGTVEENHGRLMGDELLTDEYKVAEIAPLQPFKKEIVNHDGSIGELALYHVGFTFN